jgi:predicted membrane-bound mannosyltransferase
MTRLVLTIVLPLLLPTAVYLLWLVSWGRSESAEATAWRTLPWVWLVTTGVALAALLLVVMVQFGVSRDGTYVAPHLENGQVVPGHTVAAPARR